MRDQVFISYSHKDREWLERLQTVLKPLVRKGTVQLWDDTRLQAGQKWQAEIGRALERTQVAVLLVSPDFLASEFIAEHELPPLLNAAERDGLTIVWVPVRDCLYGETEIADYQAAWDPEAPLASLTPAEADRALVQVCRKIKAATESKQPPEPDEPPKRPLRRAQRPDGRDTVEPGEAEPPAHAPDLLRILPGTWQVQIQTPFPGAMGQMRLDLVPDGSFRGQLMTPMGMTMVEGRWQADPISRQVALQGSQTNGFQVIPYAVMVQFGVVEPRRLAGMTGAGEQVVWQKV